LLHQLMERVGMARFDLAGNSMGGVVAAWYAR
jgi:pimeloyl-ACP methyl ester carboxylesterase